MSENREETKQGIEKSLKIIGQLYPVLIKKGTLEILDGRTRSQIYPAWEKKEIDVPKDWPYSKDLYYAAVQLYANYRRRVSLKERKSHLLLMASFLEDHGVPREKIASFLADGVTPFSQNYLQRLLPKKYKETKFVSKKPSPGRPPKEKEKEAFIGIPPKFVKREIPSEEKPDIDRDIASGRVSENIKWILQNSVDDINYQSNVPRLTNAELKYCLEHETRATGLQELEREWKKRTEEGGLAQPTIPTPIPTKIPTPTPTRLKLPEKYLCPVCHTEHDKVCCPHSYHEWKLKDFYKLLKEASS